MVKEGGKGGSSNRFPLLGLLKSLRVVTVWWKSLSLIWLFATHSPWNFPGQNTGVGSLSLLQGIFPTQDWTQVSHIAGGFLTGWATREAQEYWSGLPIPSPASLPGPGIKPGSPALQVDILPTELSGKPNQMSIFPDFTQLYISPNSRNLTPGYITLIVRNDTNMQITKYSVW